jgi:enoyl-CoA hydratase/carnithine racemase
VVDEQLLYAGRVRAEQSGPLLTVTLDRPDQLNAQTPATWRALAAIGADLAPDVRVVVLRGVGRSFSAGLDRAMFEPSGASRPDSGPTLADLAGQPVEVIDSAIEGFQRAFAWWSEAPVVTIAAVQGHAVGAGFQLALACDLRVLADDARLAMRETSLGLVPDLTGTGRLVACVGYARALEICATSRWVGAAEARAIGLANAVVPAGQLESAVGDLVDALLASPQVALRETLLLLRGAAGRTPHEQHAAERAAQARLLRGRSGPRANGS